MGRYLRNLNQTAVANLDDGCDNRRIVPGLGEPGERAPPAPPYHSLIFLHETTSCLVRGRFDLHGLVRVVRDIQVHA